MDMRHNSFERIVDVGEPEDLDGSLDLSGSCVHLPQEHCTCDGPSFWKGLARAYEQPPVGVPLTHAIPGGEWHH